MKGSVSTDSKKKTAKLRRSVSTKDSGGEERKTRGWVADGVVINNPGCFSYCVSYARREATILVVQALKHSGFLGLYRKS